MSRMIMSPR